MFLESHFLLNWNVNRQNMFYFDIAVTSRKFTVWCGLYADGIIGPFFFRRYDGQSGILNGDRYKAMINYFFVSKLDGTNIYEIWYQQDGTTFHATRETMKLLQRLRVISNNGSVNWPLRFSKSQVYADKPQSTIALEAHIR